MLELHTFINGCFVSLLLGEWEIVLDSLVINSHNSIGEVAELFEEFVFSLYVFFVLAELFSEIVTELVDFLFLYPQFPLEDAILSD